MAIVVTTACVQSPLVPSQLGTVEQLVDALRREGLIVSVGDKLSPGYLSVPARRVPVNAEALYVFEYSTATQAATDAAQISPDAQPGPRTRVTWVNTPTFYHRGTLIVLHLGCLSDVVAALDKLLGPAIAIGRTRCTTAGAPSG
jgi:hypothetical protein